LHLLALVLLCKNSIFDLFSISSQIVQDCSFVRDPLVAFFIQVNVVDVDLLLKRRKRIVKIRDSVSSLLRTHIIQSLDPVVASADFVSLILALLLKGIVEVLVQAFKLFFKFSLVGF